MTAAAELIHIDGEDLCIRGLEPADRAYVASTWGASYFSRANVTREVYRIGHSRVIDRCLDDARTVVLCDSLHRNSLLGFACGQRAILHYVYVADVLRRTGAAEMLIHAVTDLEKHARGLCSHRFRPRAKPSLRFTFNPYLVGFYE